MASTESPAPLALDATSPALSSRAAAGPGPHSGVGPPDSSPPHDAIPAPAPEGRDPGGYAIQLLILANDAGLAAFAQRHAGVGQFRILQGQHRGKAWVALLVGDYATRSEAEAALAAIPQDL